MIRTFGQGIVISFFLMVAHVSATPILQEISAVGVLVVVNTSLCVRYQTGHRLQRLSLFLIASMVGITYWQYYNALHLGFQDGILSGYIGDNLYDDTAFYYDESVQLSENLRTQSWLEYLKGESDLGGYYGPYNLYVLWNAILCLVFGENVTLWVLVKMVFTVASYVYLFLLCRLWMNETNALWAVFVYAVFPGNILANVTLMRDNIMSLLVIFFYYQLTKLASGRRLSTTAKLIGAAIVSFVLRGYSIILFMPVLVFEQLKKIKTPLHALYLILGLVALVGASSILLSIEFLSQSFVALQSAKEFFASGGSWSVLEERSSGVASLVYAVYYAVFGSQPSALMFELHVVQELINYCAYVYLNLVLTLSTIGLIVIVRNKVMGRSEVLILGAVTPVLYLALYTFAFGGPVPRIYNLTIWINALLIGIFCQYATRRRVLMVFSVISLMTSGVYIYKYWLR